jgi:aspartoacylase
MTQAAADVLHKCQEDNIFVLMHTHKNQQERSHCSSIASHCFSIEFGPVPQGVLRNDVVEKTQRALAAALEFLDRHNNQPEEL